MASAAEQLAANLNLKAFSKAEDLKKRIWFTLGVLIIYRLGTYIPLPGINPAVMAEFARSHGGGIFGMVDMFLRGCLEPYVDYGFEHHALYISEHYCSINDSYCSSI